MIQVMKRNSEVEEDVIRAWSDSDWAGCRTSRKSTSGGVMIVGGHVLRTYSSTQSVIALSSAEPEFYALFKACSTAIGMQSLARDFGENLQIEMGCDSSAAIGISYRLGLGKVRHLHTQQL